MNRWFRHYPGLARDEKLVAAALRARQPIERVVWLWCAILEDASTRNDGGAFVLDPDECAYFLRVAPADIGRILAELEVGGRINRGQVTSWNTRQKPSDISTGRTAAWRERLRNGVVTKGNRSRNGPESESESEKRKKKKTAKPSQPAEANDAVMQMADAIEAWNALAKRIDKPLVGSLDEPQFRRLEKLLADHSAAEFVEVLAAIERSRFLQGETGWGGLDFSWIIDPRNFEKVASGRYDQ